MSSRVKQLILNKVYDAVHQRANLITPRALASQLVSVKNETDDGFKWQLQLPLAAEYENDRQILSVQLNSFDMSTKIDPKINVTHARKAVEFEISSCDFIKDVLDSDPVDLTFKPEKKKVIVEFSSPNVAKPFHFGHLRSTIHGNYISNLNTKLGNNVTKMNFLGDWGTQFGLLKLGLELTGCTDDQLQTNPLKFLLEAYVEGNRKALQNQEVFEKAKEIFKKMEGGDEEYLKFWSRIKTWSIEELERTYKRIGISFSEYSWESDYNISTVQKILDTLELLGLLIVDENGRKTIDLGNRLVPLVKSDGSTLYICRDLAALLDRRDRYKFDEMYYVVENGQTEHFRNMFDMAKELSVDNSWNLHHVKFGKIHGLSTRKGNVLFLDDILNKARDLMYQKQKDVGTTKGEPSLEVASILGNSAVIINDLKMKRTRDYELIWDNVLQITGNSGILLQYAHCRLTSIIKKSGLPIAKDCDPNALMEPDAKDLVLQISMYEERLLHSYNLLEASVLTIYLFKLSHCSNKAVNSLRVLGTDSHVASQRLLLFNSAKLILADGMRILGLEPLDEM